MRQILHLSYYEIRHIMKDPVLLGIVLLVPMLYAALMGIIYSAGALHSVPLGIIDLNNSAQSRALIEAFENTPNFKINPDINTYEDLTKAMENGVIMAGVVIPSDYAEQQAQHRLSRILTIYDGSNLIYTYNSRRFMQQVLTTASTSHTTAYLINIGMNKPEIKAVMNNAAVNTQVWYNPTYSYYYFILPGLLVLIFHQIGLLGIGLTISREKDRNSWLQYLSAPLPSWKIYIGKGLPYLIANYFNFVILLCMGVHFFNLKAVGEPNILLLLGLFFTLIITSLGFIISIYSPNSLQTVRYMMLLSVPFFLLSGNTWPLEKIPDFLHGLGLVLPYTWMSEAYRQVIIKEQGFNDLATTMLVFCASTIIILFFALTFSKKRKN